MLRRARSLKRRLLNGGGLVPPAPTPPVNTVAPSISGDAVVGQRLYKVPGTWTNSPTITDQWYKDGVAISGETADNYLVVDADVGSVFKVRETGVNGAGSATADSANTSAVTAIDNGGAAGTIPNAITAFSRTSTSGDNSNAFGMQVSITFGSNVYEGYTLHAHVYSDSALTTLTQDVPLLLTHDLVQSGADVPSALLAAGLTKLGATDWLQLTVETTSPNGLYYSYTSSTVLTPTDAVAAMTFSTTDEVGMVYDAGGGNLWARGFNPAAARTNRAAASGKRYVEFIPQGASFQVELLDSSAALTTDQSSGGSPSTHAAVYQADSTTANFNTNTITVGTWNTAAAYTCSISGTTLTVTGSLVGTVAVGQYVTGPNIAWGTKIMAGSGSTWTVNISQTRADDGIQVASGPVIGMAWDDTADKVWWSINGVWQNSGDPAAGTGALSTSGIGHPVYPGVRMGGSGYRVGFFPGTQGSTSGFIFTPPTGFTGP